MIDIRLPKQRLVFTEAEFQSLMYQHPELWVSALKRGKTVNRHEEEVRRNDEKCQRTLAGDRCERSSCP